MGENTSELLNCCLYFTANSLARVITKMAEQEFGLVGLTPSHAFLLMLAIEKPGVSQKELAESLHLAPSTVSRFVDSLVHRGFVRKEGQGRNTFIHPTESGLSMEEPIAKAWKRLYERYSEILGQEAGNELTGITAKACAKLEQNL